MAETIDIQERDHDRITAADIDEVLERARAGNPPATEHEIECLQRFRDWLAS